MKEPKHLEEAYQFLTKKYKDEPLLRIYKGGEANELYRKHVDSESGAMDEEHEETTLYICSDFEQEEAYLEGAFYGQMTEEGLFEISWACSPGDPHVGIKNVCKALDAWKREVMPHFS